MISIQEILMSLDIGMIYGIIAIGIYLTFRTINFSDLTCDGSFVFGAAVSAVLIKQGINPYIAILAAFLSGGIAGLFTGVLNVYFKITDLLSGIIVAFMLYSINLKVMGNSPNITFADNITIFSFSKNIHLLNFSIITIIALFFVYLLYTSFGLALRSIGNNKNFSNIAGINVNFMTITGLFISNGLIGFGGAMFTQYQGFCDISQGFGTLVIGLASVIIGESLIKFKNTCLMILTCLVGSVIYRIFISTALHSDVFGIETQDLNLITGIMIIIIIFTKQRRVKC